MDLICHFSKDVVLSLFNILVGRRSFRVTAALTSGVRGLHGDSVIVNYVHSS